MPRIYHPFALSTGQALALTPEGARHVQVLRLQPGDDLTLFGDPVRGGEFAATVLRMGRSDVEVEVGAHRAIDREPARAVHLAVGMPPTTAWIGWSRKRPNWVWPRSNH